MAWMLPDSPLYRETGSFAERRVYDALKAKMPDDWLAIHSFRWVKSSATKKGKPQGEGDFILFHPDYGMIVIEVKGGDINYCNHIWSTIDGTGVEHNIQDPEKQASDTKFEIIKRLKDNFIYGCFVCHAVWFPDCDSTQIIFPVNLDKKTVFDIHTLDNPLPKILNALEYWQQRTGISPITLNKNISDKIIKLLNPEIRMVRTMKSRCDDTNNLYVRLNAEQARVLEMLDECQAVHIIGRAGTGKTLLALEKGRRDVALGGRAILLCYNSELAQRLKESDESELFITSIHSFALAYMEKYHPNRIIGFNDSPDFDYLMEEFAEVANDVKEKFDTIIIDEGQDFKENWVSSIHNFLAEEANFFVFYDPYQHLYSPLTEMDDKYLKIGFPLILNRNMRNTDQISRSCLNVINIPVNQEYLNGIQGIEPEVIVYEDGTLDPLLEKIIHRLNCIQGIDNQRISVITLETEKTSAASRNLQEKLPEFMTVRKFKGLENDVVIIIDVKLANIVDPVRQRLLYVALSRARVHAVILVKIDARYKGYLMREWFCSEKALPHKIVSYIKEGNVDGRLFAVKGSQTNH